VFLNGVLMCPGRFFCDFGGFGQGLRDFGYDVR